MFKKLAMMFLLALVVSFPVEAVVLEQMQTSTIPEKISSATPLFVALSTGSGSSTAPLEVAVTSVAYATSTFTVLATNAVTLFQSVASFTDGDTVMFQGRGKFYWSVSSNPTATAAEMQLRSYTAEAGDPPVMIRLKTTANLAFVADSSSIATLTYSLIREQ